MRLTHLVSSLALGAPLAIALTSTGCAPLTKDCTNALFYSGLIVDVDLPGGAATYRFEVEAEDETLQLSVEVDVDRASGSCASQCLREGERIAIRGTPFIGLDTRTIQVIVSTDNENSGPREATLRVYRGDVLAAEQTFQPRYETDEPNGDGCGERTFAVASMAVP
jgi:hypothetical protein